ncbi:leucyl aminopeptidase [Cyanobacterium sp. uoEpiScrs1]|uniref:leucyl aminopeptidase n=1 Tax=Cyanobacterium sp. uoEpiScrs1 TaxID=2976343 RepID=UPI00226A9F32|nr:leucyl aminopeptidase [Cyanobacterium sp. uoEpiScrs1]
MDIRGIDTPLLDWTGDTLALGLFEDAMELTGILQELDEKLSGTLRELIEEIEFEGKPNNSAVNRIGSNSPIRKVILVGLGKTEDLSLDVVRLGAATISRLAKQAKVKTLGINLPVVNDDVASTVNAITQGIILSLHQDKRFKSEPDKNGLKLERVEILGCGKNEKAINQANILCSGVILARELVAAPANSVTPVTFAEIAQTIAKDHELDIEILDREKCEDLGMGAFLGVAQASDFPPNFIHLTYKPSETPQKKLAIVGKSLTFDSGGLNLKGAGSSIETMKMDMGGGAATLGAAKVIGQLKPDVEVHFICAVTENMISGCAMHPGDILTASNGKTIEVNNTDAEGRLTLADALVFAEKLGVDAIVDLATLTGACIVALGDNIAGLWSTDKILAAQLREAGSVAGENFWEMPLEEKYFEGLKSPIADIKNTGPRAGGAITAALFLKQFIKKTPWAHLDIAGPVWLDKENGVNNSGATGFPVRTLVNWVLNQ